MFFRNNTPPLVAMIQCKTSKECIEKIERSYLIGAEAFGIQLCQLQKEERNETTLKTIFSACHGLPIYVTSYRVGENKGLSDDMCAKLLIDAAKCGAHLCDIPSDFFDAQPNQMTEKPEAIVKQKALANELRSYGAEVLYSTHDFRELSIDEILHLAYLQNLHGADVLKIVVKSETQEKLPEYVEAIQRVNKEFQKPFLFLDVGACSDLLRKIGGVLGSCMYLCVESHGPLDTKQQPTLLQVKQIRDAFKG